MGWKVNGFMLRGSLEGILEVMGDIYDTNGEVLCGSSGNNQPECACCQDCKGGMVKVNSFYLGSTIRTMTWSVEVYIVTDILDGWG